MRIETNQAVPAFEPITVTLETVEEARVLKMLCTTTATNAVLTKSGLSVSTYDVNNFADGMFRALKAKGVSYLTKNG